jgi:hypothetical protein
MITEMKLSPLQKSALAAQTVQSNLFLSDSKMPRLNAMTLFAFRVVKVL